MRWFSTAEPSLSPTNHLRLKHPSRSQAGWQTLTHYLEDLSDVARRFDLVDITFLEQDQRPLVEHVSAVAYRPHYRGGTWPWTVKFRAASNQVQCAGARFSGDLQLGRDSEQSGHRSGRTDLVLGATPARYQAGRFPRFRASRWKRQTGSFG